MLVFYLSLHNVVLYQTVVELNCIFYSGFPCVESFFIFLPFILINGVLGAGLLQNSKTPAWSTQAVSVSNVYGAATADITI